MTDFVVSEKVLELWSVDELTEPSTSSLGPASASGQMMDDVWALVAKYTPLTLSDKQKDQVRMKVPYAAIDQYRSGIGRSLH